MRMGYILAEIIPNQGLDSTVRNMQSKIMVYEVAAETVFIAETLLNLSRLPVL
jgi:hypothetical protein